MPRRPVTLNLDVTAEGGSWASFPDAQTLARQVAELCLVKAGKHLPPIVELSILLTDDGAIRQLNKAWREKDKATNVLSFPAPGGVSPSGPAILGDVVMAYQTLAREAREAGISFAHHFAHLCAHGILHLLGYDHETDGDAERMEALEAEILAILDIPNPYRDSQHLDLQTLARNA